MSEEMVAKYREGFDAMAATSVRLAEMVKRGDERIRELEAALDSDPDGSGYWRFWSKKASEQAERASSSQARLSEAVKVLEELGTAVSIYRLGVNDTVPKIAAGDHGDMETIKALMANNDILDASLSKARQFLATLGEER